MKKGGQKMKVVLTILAVLFVLGIVLPLTFSLFDGGEFGNVALIPIEGTITADGSSYLGQGTTSAQDLIGYIQEADANSQVEVIVLEINSPGGSAVASDEVATAIKKTKKPTVALIREVGASGGYWIASATDYVVANRMSITGSIGVISSYLEFSGLMEKYGVGYERLVAGKYKDMGVPFRTLSEEERALMQKKINKIQDYFIAAVAENRNLPESKVRSLATGEFFLGVEALQLGLVDALGDRSTVEDFIKNTYGLDEVDYLSYQREKSLVDLLTGVLNDFSFQIGQGIGAIFVQGNKPWF